MSAGFANWQGASAGKGRSASADRRIDARPLRLTVRRVKFACSLFVGALMLGVVSNAMLLQTAHAPINVASNAAPRDEPGPTGPRVETPPANPRTSTVPAAAASRDVDSLPVGTISPKVVSHPRPRTRPVVQKARSIKPDGITAFLRADTSRAAAHPAR